MKNRNMCCKKHLLAKKAVVHARFRSNKNNQSTVQNKERTMLICSLHIVSTEDYYCIYNKQHDSIQNINIFNNSNHKAIHCLKQNI